MAAPGLCQGGIVPPMLKNRRSLPCLFAASISLAACGPDPVPGGYQPSDATAESKPAWSTDIFSLRRMSCVRSSGKP